MTRCSGRGPSVLRPWPCSCITEVCRTYVCAVIFFPRAAPPPPAGRRLIGVWRRASRPSRRRMNARALIYVRQSDAGANESSGLQPGTKAVFAATGFDPSRSDVLQVATRTRAMTTASRDRSLTRSIVSAWRLVEKFKRRTLEPSAARWRR
jgi:hypothetical protein